MTGSTLQRYCRALVEETALLADHAAGVAPDAPVPTCPEWTLRDLVEHVGQTQQFVTSIVADRVTDPSQLSATFSALPAGPDAWREWLTEGASLLAAAFADAGADAAVWNPSGDSRTGAQFWLRRVVAETVIHRADAAATAGVPYEVDADLATDVITDQLDMLTSPGWAAMVPGSVDVLRGTGQALHLHSDEGGDWFVERGPAGATWRPGDGDADVTVSGPAVALLLVLTRRRPVDAALRDGLQASGDLGLFTHWVGNTAHRAT